MEKLDGMPFPVATRRELERGGMLRAQALGRDLVVLWNGGRPRVFVDACPHLGMPLSMGRLEREAAGELLRCRYHGWAFSTDDGEVREQPTLALRRPCRPERWGALLLGGLVFAWRGGVDASAEAAARAALPPPLPDDWELHRLVFEAPFYLALWNAVDYAHFARHTGYPGIYAAYRRLRRDSHVPGQPFHWESENAGPEPGASEDSACLRFVLPEARRRLRLYATAAEFEDDGGLNAFHTFVTPLGPSRTLYWECYRARSGPRWLRAAARAAFRAAVVPLLDGEDRDWTSRSAPNFLRGDNIHLSENDAPLGEHLRRFVVPRMRAGSVPAPAAP
jgi:phenylpropionate dioxygenase-like ring-hydroxylating dioxygenase large terminal subunit